MANKGSVEDRTKAVENQLDSIEKNLEANVEERVQKGVQQYVEKNKSELLAGLGLNANIGHTRSDSMEQKTLRMFGAKNWRDLIDINVCDRKFSKVPSEYKHLALQLKTEVDISRYMSQRFYEQPNDKDDFSPSNPLAGVASVKGMTEHHRFGREVLAPRLKAFDTVTDAALVPTAISSQYIEEFELQREVIRMFQTITMPTKQFNIPKQDGTTIARIQGENATKTAAQFGNADIQFNAVKLCEYYEMSSELDEDSAPAILSIARDQVVQAMDRAWETATINGDSDGTHQDADSQAGGADLAVKAWDGLRKLALANSANGSTVDFGGLAATLNNTRAMRIRMGKYGVNPAQLAYLASPKVYFQLLDFDEVKTIESFGNDATVKTGMLAALDGIKIIQSEFMRDDLDATGVQTNVPANDIFSSLMLVNHRRFMLGVRRPMRVRAVFHPVPPNDQWLLASWWRGDFKGHGQDADEVSAVLGYNIA